MRKLGKSGKSGRGFSLVELMVAVSILSIGILGFISAFRYITRSIHISRSRTIATNLAQEKVENLKNLSYFELLITTSSSVDNDFSPAIIYDAANYPPETVTIGGIRFTRYTFVSLAQIDNNVISTVTYTYPDTGMKQITVHIKWAEEGIKKKWSLSNLLENPNVAPLDASFSGIVSEAGTGSPVANATVQTQEVPDYNDTTDSTGYYTFRVYHGSYTLKVSTPGYYATNSARLVASAGSNTSQNLTLTKIATGTINTMAWLNPNLVISQVVVETNTWAGEGWGGQKNVEYIELFNPTTYQIDVYNPGAGTPLVRIDYDCEAAGFDRSHADMNFVFMSTYVPAGRNYLLANATTMIILGTMINADACWGSAANCDTVPTFPDYLDDGRAGSVRLRRYSDNAMYDTVGWDDNNNTACAEAYCEGTSIPNYGIMDGMETGNQIIRVAVPLQSAADQANYGPAYDTGDNRSDFFYPSAIFMGLTHAPRNITYAAQTVVTGVPAEGAMVASDDPNSGAATMTRQYISSGATGINLAYAEAELQNVTTGTWNVIIASSGYFRQITSVVVAQNSSTSAPNGSTTPAWPIYDYPMLVLDSSTLNGFVTGLVEDTQGRPISAIQINAGGVPATTTSNGRYFVQVSSGPITVLANANNQNPLYVQGLAFPTIQSGSITDQGFTLAQGGQVRGFVTSGTTPLPNIVITVNLSGSQYGVGSSDSTGSFLIKNLSTNTYTVQPVLGSGQYSSPSSVSATLTSTGAVNVGTFTITGAFGSIAGEIRYNSALLTSGALILASTATIPTSPTSIAASSAPAQTVLYSVSSKADGTYTLQTRGGSTYRISAYIPIIQTNGTVSITTKTYSGIAVTAGQTTTHNISVP